MVCDDGSVTGIKLRDVVTLVVEDAMVSAKEVVVVDGAWPVVVDGAQPIAYPVPSALFGVLFASNVGKGGQQFSALFGLASTSVPGCAAIGGVVSSMGAGSGLMFKRATDCGEMLEADSGSP
ncbi:hypothetical protein Dimus_020746 [Dionaea muscipula]